MFSLTITYSAKNMRLQRRKGGVDPFSEPLSPSGDCAKPTVCGGVACRNCKTRTPQTSDNWGVKCVFTNLHPTRVNCCTISIPIFRIARCSHGDSELAARSWPNSQTSGCRSDRDVQHPQMYAWPRTVHVHSDRIQAPWKLIRLL